MPSRKKAKGKARKAAKAKEESRVVVAAGQRQEESVEAQMQGLKFNHITYVDCKHGCSLLSDSEAKIYVEFIETFIAVFCSGVHFQHFLTAYHATKEKYPSMYSSKLEAAISILLSYGTQMILEGDNHTAGLYAMIAFFFEDYLAVKVRKTKEDPCLTKILELQSADDHTLVSYYRKRIPCSCLDEKYKEVKSIKKIGRCYNPNCSLPDGRVERSKMFSCTRCGEANYCSVECQKSHWKKHKQYCAETVKAKAAFSADQS